jgi:hypothetical protein
LLPAAGRAQAVALQIREEVTQRLVVGAVVRLVRDSTVVAEGLTSGAGRVVLRAPAPGTYDVRVNRIGFRPVAAGGDSVGLAFEPVRGRRGRAGRGTLWVDRATSELRALDYRYTDLPGIARDADLGGHVEFRRLPDGAWIVGHWYVRMYVRMPRVERDRLSGSPTLAAYIEAGGRVDTIPSAATWSQVAGVVFDSTTMSPLVGAVVRVAGERDSAVTDAAGRYELAVIGAGTRTVLAEHPRLTFVDSARAAIALAPGETTFVRFTVPSAATIAAAICGVTTNRSGLVGLTRGRDGQSSSDLRLVIDWSSTSQGMVRFLGIERRAGGLFAACNLPPLQTLTVRVEGVGTTKLRLQPGEFRWVELGPAPRATAGPLNDR